ncbi:MAG: EpsG family protein, partial [Pyrinomonadaceae bacterium]
MHFLLIPYALLSLIFVVHFLSRHKPGAPTGLAVIATLTLTMMFAAMLLRPVAGDSWRYYQYFLNVREMRLGEALSYRVGEPLYALFNWVVGIVGGSAVLLFGSTLLVFLGAFLIALRKLVGITGTILVVMCYSAYPFFIAFAATGLRQGLALVFLLLAYVHLFHGRKAGWIWLALAPLWHSGAWLAVGIVLLHQTMCRLVTNERLRWGFVFGSLFAAIALSASGFNEVLMSRLPALFELRHSHEIYFRDPAEVGYQAGFRIDFFIFSLLPLLVAWLLRG